MPNVIRLNGDLDDFPILGGDGVALAPVGAQHGGGGELEVPGAGEGAVGVAEEADPRGLFRVEGLAPGVHAVVVSSDLGPGGRRAREAYTKASLTEMTKTLPASLILGCEM